MDSKGFIVYGDLEAVLDELTDKQVSDLFRGMVSYHNSGTDPNFDGILKYVFIPIKQQMDRNTEKYKERCEKNRKNRQDAWNKLKGIDTNVNDCNQSNTIATNTKTKTKTNTNTKTKTETDTNTESAGADVWALSLSVLSHLNQQAGSSWRTDDAASVRLISDLSHQGYTEEQMKDVIDKKCDEWLGDPKMEHYLRPSTLFKPDNFVKYLNAPDSARRQKQEQDAEDARAMAERIRRIDEQAEAEMERMKAHHEQFMKENGLWTT